MHQMHASALLFDMDGTLVDSTALVESTWSSFSQLHDLDFSEVLAFAHGRPTKATVSHFISDRELAASEARRLVSHEESETTGIREVPGSAALLATLPPETWAIVTSASRNLAEVRLAAAGLPLPAVLVTADEVSRGKPHPEGYLRAAAILGVNPADTIIFEDSSAGVRAGLDSGAQTVVIGALTNFDKVAERHVDFSDFKVDTKPDSAGVLLNVAEPVTTGVAK